MADAVRLRDEPLRRFGYVDQIHVAIKGGPAVVKNAIVPIYNAISRVERVRSVMGEIGALAPGARICSAGDTARQFVVQRLFAGPSLGPVPFALWVEPEPIRMKHRDCTCRVAFAVTPESALQRMGRKTHSYVVCPCMGHFIE